MANTYESKIRRWPGSVLLPDYMTFSQLLVWEKVLAEARGLGEAASVIQFYGVLLPMVCDLVVEWHLSGLPEKVSPDNFPASPELLAWLVTVSIELFKTSNEIDPN